MCRMHADPLQMIRPRNSARDTTQETNVKWKKWKHTGRKWCGQSIQQKTTCGRQRMKQAHTLESVSGKASGTASVWETREKKRRKKHIWENYPTKASSRAIMAKSSCQGIQHSHLAFLSWWVRTSHRWTCLGRKLAVKNPESSKG